MEDLKDIRQLSIGKEGIEEEQIADFILQTEEAYICRCGNLMIQSVFTDPDITLTERLAQYGRMLL